MHPSEGERSEPESAALCARVCVCARSVSESVRKAFVYRASGRIELEIRRQFY